MLRVITTKPQYFYSVRIDQRQHRAIHVLPEKYQFCALGSIRSVDNFASSNSQSSQVFGRCRAKVHYGLCTDFDVFVVNESDISQQQSLPASPSAASNSSSITRFIYSIKTPSIQPPNSAAATKPVGVVGSTNETGQPLSPTDRSIAQRIESYRENIGAALELLDQYDEPAQLQNLIR